MFSNTSCPPCECGITWSTSALLGILPCSQLRYTPQSGQLVTPLSLSCLRRWSRTFFHVAVEVRDIAAVTSLHYCEGMSEKTRKQKRVERRERIKSETAQKQAELRAAHEAKQDELKDRMDAYGVQRAQWRADKQRAKEGIQEYQDAHHGGKSYSQVRRERKRATRQEHKAEEKQARRDRYVEQGLLSAFWGPYQLWSNGYLVKSMGKDKGRVYLGDVEVLDLDQGAEFQKRFTGSRVLLLGVFSPLFRKQSGGEYWFVVSGGGADWLEEVQRKQVPKAMKFFQKVKALQRQL